MTHKERVLAAIEGQPVDRTPIYHVTFSSQAAAVILGREALVGGAFVQWREMEALFNGPQAHEEFNAACEADAVAVAKAFDHDILRLNYWRWPRNQVPTKRVGEYTFLFGDSDNRWYTMTYHPDLELLTRQDGLASHLLTHTVPHDQELTEEALRQEVLREEAETEAFEPPTTASGIAREILKYPNYLVRQTIGFVNIGMDSAQELLAVGLWPELYARKLMAKAQRIAATVPARSAAGMRVAFTSGDFCSNAGPAVSPSMFRDVVAPALKTIVDACHAYGIRYFYGSDGNFWPVAECLFNEIGIDGWFELDRSAGMDLRLLRERFPRVTLVGNIRSQVLHRGTKDDVVQETLSCLKAAKELGGIIVGTSNLIMPETPPENILIMLNVIRENR